MRRIIILLFITAFLVSAVNVYSQGPTPTPPVPSKAEENKPTAKDKDAKSEHTPSQNHSPAIHDIKTVPTNQKEKNQAKNTGDEATIKWTDWLITAFTCVLSIFTALLWWSTDKMWKATKTTAEAAKDSANTLHAIEKAYIIVTAAPGKPVIFGEDVVDVTIWNDGRTPATIIKCRAIVLGKKDAFDMEGSDILPGTEIGGSRNYPISLHITGDGVRGAQQGIEIYCHAFIEYEDIFQQRYIKRCTWKNKSDISRPDGYWVSCDSTELDHYT